MKRFSKKRFLLYIKQAFAFAELPESDFEKRYSTLAEMWCITHKQPFTKNGKQLFEKAFSNNEKLYLALPETIRAAVKEAHAKGCKFRLWGYPDNSEAWRLAMELGLDYLNTDHPAAAAGFLRTIK